MSFIAHGTLPTSPPKQLGGTTTDCFLSGSEIVFASMSIIGPNSNVYMYSWDKDQAAWFLFPVDPVALSAGTNSGRAMQRYVTGKDPQGAYYTFFYTSTDSSAITISIRLADGQ